MPWPFDKREKSVDPITGESGSNQNLTHAAAHHDDEPLSIVARSNVVEGLPKFDTRFIPAITEGKPSPVNPTGVGGSASEEEAGEGAGDGGGDGA